MVCPSEPLAFAYLASSSANLPGPNSPANRPSGHTFIAETRLEPPSPHCPSRGSHRVASPPLAISKRPPAPAWPCLFLEPPLTFAAISNQHPAHLRLFNQLLIMLRPPLSSVASDLVNMPLPPTAVKLPLGAARLCLSASLSWICLELPSRQAARSKPPPLLRATSAP